MKLIKEEQLIITNILEFDGYKSSAKLSLSDTVKLKFPTVRFMDYNLSFRFNASKTKVLGVKFGCQEPSITTIKKVIAQLSGEKTLEIGVENIETGKFTQIELLEESENYIVTKNCPYPKSKYKISEQFTEYKILKTSANRWGPSMYSINSYDLGAVSNKDQILTKLKMIVEIYDFIKKQLAEIYK